MTPKYDCVRSAGPIWYFRFLQLLITFIVLGLAGEAASEWKGLFCNTPANVAFNIAAAVLTLPPIIYLLVSSGPKTSSHVLPWNQWAQLVLDAVLFIFWIAAAAASTYTCSGLCAACAPTDQGYGYYPAAGNLACACAEPGDYRRSRQIKRVLERGSRSAINAADAKAGLTLAKIAAKQGFDALMVISLFITLCLTIQHILKARKATAGHAAPAEVGHEYQAVNMGEGGKNNAVGIQQASIAP